MFLVKENLTGQDNHFLVFGPLACVLQEFGHLLNKKLAVKIVLTRFNIILGLALEQLKERLKHEQMMLLT